LRYNAAVRHEPARPTLNALRAARDARRVATDVLLDRVTGLGAVHCVDCGRPIAVRTDASHPARNYEGRVVCGPCLRARRNPHPLAHGITQPRPPVVDYEPRPPQQEALELPTQPDPRPTLREWLRQKFGWRAGEE